MSYRDRSNRTPYLPPVIKISLSEGNMTLRLIALVVVIAVVVGAVVVTLPPSPQEGRAHKIAPVKQKNKRVFIRLLAIIIISFPTQSIACRTCFFKRNRRKRHASEIFL